MTLLCATRCAIPGRHTDGCDDQTCRGCIPARAADGLRLCGYHTERIRRDILGWRDKHGTDQPGLVQLYDELELALKATSAGGRGPSKPGSGGPPRDEVVAMRHDVRNLLVSWAKLIADERGHAYPADRITAIGAMVAGNAEWLAAQDFAGDVADELNDMRRRAFSYAYPSGARRFAIEPCPRCGGVPYGRRWAVERLPAGFVGPPRRAGMLIAVMRDSDEKLPPVVFCDLVEEHRWASAQWRELDRLVARRRAA